MSHPRATSEPLAGPWRWALGALLLATFASRLWSASHGLDSQRNFDERFTLHNVRAFLDGRFEPANAYYPSLSYLPQTAVLALSQGLHRATGWALPAVLGEGGTFLPAGYWLARLVSVLYGTLSVWVLFRIGRRLFGPGVGLGAAAVLAGVPHHMASSVAIKPDILVVLLTLAALERTLEALERPGWRGYAVVGALVGLATAAKYTGAAAALPLIAAALWPSEEGRSRLRQRFGWLVGAGLAAIVVFVLLNPFLGKVLSYVPEIAEIYETKGEKEGGSHLEVLRREWVFLTRHHTLPGAVFALGGLAALAWVGWRAGEPERRRIVVLLAYPLGYSLGYAAVTTLFKGQNYLPVAAFTALGAAWAWVALGRVVGNRWVGSRPMLPVLGGAALVAVLLPACSYAYQDVVPSTALAASKRLLTELSPVEQRSLAFERLDREQAPLRVNGPGGRIAGWVVRDLAAEPGGRLDGLDAEVFLAERLVQPFHAARAARAGVRLERVGARWFAARGPELVILWHPWRLQGEPLPLAVAATDRPRRFVAALPGDGADAWLSFVVELPKPAEDRARELRVDGQPVRLFLTQDLGRRGLFLSDRLRLGKGLAPSGKGLAPGAEGARGPVPRTIELVFLGDPLPESPPPVTLLRWQPPAAGSVPVD